ncbi:MAG: hypothetical protein OEM18_08070 [Nitrosopumilus sp.]|nr:hypothetical protein [Nitrosopumilus sp.]
MQYKDMLNSFLIAVIFFSFIFTPSYGLTESIDLFGQINSADLILNDIWIEPENPKNGEPISVHGSVYNAGIIATERVSNVVTVGYLINGELVEIDILENITPGIENGIEIVSGPIFDAIPGKYVITVIINYHDNLSHLRDNPKNNIVQKMFQIGTDIPSLVNANISQYFDNETKKQKIIVRGEITDIFNERLKSQKITVDIEKFLVKEIITDSNGNFSFETDMPFNENPVRISVYGEGNSFIQSFSQMVFPIKLDKDQSSLALEILSYSSSNLRDAPLTMVIFQDSYDNIFKKISVDYNNQNLMNDDFFFTTLPAEHEYIVEVYVEGRLLDAFQNYFPSNTVIKKEISISESSQVQFRIINEFGEPQMDVVVDNWVYSAISGKDGYTQWIETLPNFNANEPYVAKATFPNEEVIWSEPFLVDNEEKRVIQIIYRGDEK